MKKPLSLALLLALAGGSRAAEPVDPATAGTAAAAGAAPAGKQGGKDGKKRPAAPQPRAGGEGKAAAPKDEKPCQPVKPCPID